MCFMSMHLKMFGRCLSAVGLAMIQTSLNHFYAAVDPTTKLNIPAMSVCHLYSDARVKVSPFTIKSIHYCASDQYKKMTAVFGKG